MASRKRKAGESFAQYRVNLKREGRMISGHLQGRLKWNSKLTTKTFRHSLNERKN